MRDGTFPATDSQALVRVLQGPSPGSGRCVLYWMQAAQRAHANPALDHAALHAQRLGVPLVVVFVLVPSFGQAQAAHYRFMLEGLAETAAELTARGVIFRLGGGSPPDLVAAVAARADAALVVCDASWLRVPRSWRETLARKLSCPFHEVVTEQVVPPDLLYQKPAWSAAVLRRRFMDLGPLWLDLAGPVQPVDLPGPGTEPWNRVRADLDGPGAPNSVSMHRPENPAPGTAPPASHLPGLLLPEGNELCAGRVPEALFASGGILAGLGRVARVGPEFRGGHRHALAQADLFAETRLGRYGAEARDPSCRYQSDLSPWLHFGQISPLEVIHRVVSEETLSAWTSGMRPVFGKAVPEDNEAAFVEELVVRRELAVNWCRWQPRYDEYGSLPSWALATLEAHARDPRPVMYSLAELEEGRTGDRWWNACQREMLERGKMHGYMRMYWGKKLLEWMPHPRDAFALALELNDRFELDGRDPNGYAGVAWCFGLHDRPWSERAIFGQVRYMNAAGLERKFDMEAYARRWT